VFFFHLIVLLKGECSTLDALPQVSDDDVLRVLLARSVLPGQLLRLFEELCDVLLNDAVLFFPNLPHHIGKVGVDSHCGFFVRSAQT